jgi:hypothetical protein
MRRHWPLKICAKYDPPHVQQAASKYILDALEALRDIASKPPTNAENRKAQDEARDMLKYYEDLLFPPGKGA